MRNFFTGMSFGCSILSFIVGILLLVGEIMCLVKAVNSDWDPIGKREIIYTASFFTGVGSIVGWFDIPDAPAKK